MISSITPRQIAGEVSHQLVFGLAVILLFVLAACATTASASMPTTAPESAPSVEPQTAPPTAQTKPEPTIEPKPELPAEPSNKPSSQETVTRITVDELRQKMDSNANILIIDNRSKEDYDAGHIKGAISVPASAIMAGEWTAPPDKELIFY